MTTDLAHKANTLEPQDLFTGAPVKLADINPIYARLGKKTKRTYAWLHNALCAAVRQFAGRSPADVEKTLVQRGVAEAVARQAALQWKESLAIRDALEPLARSQNPTDDVLSAFEREALGLFLQKGNDVVRQELQRLVSLIGAALACKTTRSLMDCLESNARPDATGLPHRAVFFGIRSSCFVIGGGPKTKDDAGSECDCNETSEEGMPAGVSQLDKLFRSEAEALTIGVLAKLSPTNQLYFRDALLGLIAMMNGIATAGGRRRLAQAFLALPTIQALPHREPVSYMFGTVPYLCCVSVVQCIDNTLDLSATEQKFRLPNPKTGEAQQKRFAQMAGLFEKAATAASPEVNALYRRQLLCVSCLLGLLDEMKHGELEKARSFMPENYRSRWDQHRAFLEVLSRYRHEAFPEQIEELLFHIMKLYGKSLSLN